MRYTKAYAYFEEEKQAQTLVHFCFVQPSNNFSKETDVFVKKLNIYLSDLDLAVELCLKILVSFKICEALLNTFFKQLQPQRVQHP